MNIFSHLSFLFPPRASLGHVKFYQTKSKKWRWKVTDAGGAVIVNPIKSFGTLTEAHRSFDDARAIMESI